MNVFLSSLLGGWGGKTLEGVGYYNLRDLLKYNVLYKQLHVILYNYTYIAKIFLGEGCMSFKS